MSDICGDDLESFVAYRHRYSLRIEGYEDMCGSAYYREHNGEDTGRVRLSPEQFEKLVEIYEPYRYEAELRLYQYDEEDCGCWKNYYFYAFDVPKGMDEAADKLIQSYRTPGANPVVD